MRSAATRTRRAPPGIRVDLDAVSAPSRWPAVATALAGVFISAQTGSGDPLIGNPMLLQIFTAVVLGGTLLGGGRGGASARSSAPIS